MSGAKPPLLDRAAIRRHADRASARYDASAVLADRLRDDMLRRLEWTVIAPDVYNLGSGEATSFNRIIGALRTALGVSDAELPTEYFEMPAEVRRFYQDYTCADISATAMGLGWKPRWDVRSSVSKTVEWYRRHLAGEEMLAVPHPALEGGVGSTPGTNVSLRKGGDALCTGCHAAFQGQTATLHERRLEVGCRECHQAHGGQGKSLLRDAGGGPCLRCHGDKASAKGEGHPVTRAKEGDGTSFSSRTPGCLECHPVHRPGDSRTARNGRCSACHPFGASKTRPPGKGHTREEHCDMCHTFHGRIGEGGKGYRGKDLRVDILCGKCHSRYWAGDIRAGRSSGTHLSTAGDKTDLCFRCHRIHMRKEKNKDGMAYGQVQCRMVQKLSPDMAEKFAALNKFYSSVISRQSATDIADYAAENTDPVE